VAGRITVFHHHRDGDDSHRDDRRRHRAGDCAQDRADEDHRIGQPAAYGAEKLADRIEQVLGETAAFQDRAHEGEERDREQQVVGDDAVKLVGEVAEKVGADQAVLDAEKGEEQADRRERESRRIADQHEHDQPREHERRHVVAHEMDHCRGFS
jgi:hypothetical protein